MKKFVIAYCCLFMLSGLLLAGDYDELQKIVASDREYDDRFALSVSISGDYAIVGAPYENEDASDNYSMSNSGSAYIFMHDGTSWVQQAKLVASDRASSAYFGISVSISGDYAIVGAYNEHEDASGNNFLFGAGSAYIFKRDGTTWSQETKIVASDRAKSDRFGYSVSISGDYAIVGAYQEDHDASGNNTKNSAGSAYIFKRDGTSWNQEAKIVASDRDADDYFGFSVSISGDYAIVGAYLEEHDASGTDNTLYSAGSAYIFKRDGTTWSQEAKIVASDRDAYDYFGFSVSISGDYAIAGAYQEDHDASGSNYETMAGSAYIFKRDGTSWNQEAKIVASDRDADDYFGFSISISGDYAIVGAYLEDHDASGNKSLSDAGSAYIFKRDGTSWNQEAKIVASDRAASDYFAYCVSISGDYAIVGAYLEDHDASGNNNLTYAGSAYIFDKPASQAATPITLASFSAEANAGVVELTWSTESETENSHFLIYRDYEVIASVDGAGTSCETHDYSYTDDQVIPGTHVYAIADVSYAGVEKMQSSIEVVVGSETLSPENFALLNAYPNPFNPSITLNMELGSASNAMINIYNTQGELVEQLLNGIVDAGTYNIIWNASDMPSGVYIVKMIAGNYTASQKIVLMK